jgi:hypothetical protein
LEEPNDVHGGSVEKGGSQKGIAEGQNACRDATCIHGEILIESQPYSRDLRRYRMSAARISGF